MNNTNWYLIQNNEVINFRLKGYKILKWYDYRLKVSYSSSKHWNATSNSYAWQISSHYSRKYYQQHKNDVGILNSYIQKYILFLSQSISIYYVSTSPLFGFTMFLTKRFSKNLITTSLKESLPVCMYVYLVGQQGKIIWK